MKCCICGMPYNPQNRVTNYFSYMDFDLMKIETVHKITVRGNTLALCANCNKAAALAVIELRKDLKYGAYKPMLFAPMFEEEQMKDTG